MKQKINSNFLLTLVVVIVTILSSCKSTFPTADSTVECHGQILKPILNPTKRPSYPSGNQAMSEFIKSNFKLPQEAPNNENRGKVRVVLVVTKEGEICDVRITSKPHKYLDNELIRVIKMMPKWIPAINGGQNVDSYYMLDIDF